MNVNPTRGAIHAKTHASGWAFGSRINAKPTSSLVEVVERRIEGRGRGKGRAGDKGMGWPSRSRPMGFERLLLTGKRQRGETETRETGEKELRLQNNSTTKDPKR